jgi:pSer/pThr/pTyr-binding forkhead associated (FHA) protein
MMNADFLQQYSSGLLTTESDPDIQRRLSLYQVFQRLYEQNRSLLDEILQLENTGSKSLSAVAFPFIQMLVQDQQVCLVTNLLQGQTQILKQPQNIWTIGRDSRQVVLPIQDKRLSRLHAAIHYTDNQIRLIDLNSRNGTYVNSEQIRQATVLQDGDRIRLGSVTIAFFINHQTQMLPAIDTDLQAQIEQLQIRHHCTMHYADEDDAVPTDGDLKQDEQFQGLNSLEDTIMFLHHN